MNNYAPPAVSIFGILLKYAPIILRHPGLFAALEVAEFIEVRVK